MTCGRREGQKVVNTEGEANEGDCIVDVVGEVKSGEGEGFGRQGGELG